MRSFLLIVLLLPSMLFAQQKLVGKLIEKDTKVPVANATVYVNNTQISTLSNDAGIFQITIPANTSSIVISHVGFKKLSYQLKAAADTLTISLEPEEATMENVTVKSGTKGSWKTWGKLFMEQFIGVGDVAKNCRLMNPEAINFRYHEDTKMLMAWSSQPLLIENKGLGYIIHADLDYFRYYETEGVFSYSVSSFFEPVKMDKEDEKEMAASRLLAYRGSKMHFARSVFDRQPEKDGFHLYVFKAIQNEEKVRAKQYLMERQVKSIVAKNAKPGDSDSSWYYAKLMEDQDYLSIDTARIDLSARLKSIADDRVDLVLGTDTILLTYNEAGAQNISNQKLRKLTKLKFRGDGRETIEFFRDSKGGTEYSLIYFQRGGNLSFTKEGLIVSDYPPVMEGFLSGRRMAYALPFDYNPQSDLDKMGALEGIDLIVNRYVDYHKEEKEFFYTHFNKSAFFPGENIWFKIYSLNPASRQPSLKTHNVLVDLMDEKGKLVAKKVLYMQEGTAHGNFPLAADLPPGTYTFRAYTNWSKNFGRELYFTQAITVLGKSAPVAATVSSAKPEVQFFPEGGTLVAGVGNRMAFKITSPQGYGLKADGSLLQSNRQIAKLSTNHLGLGSFLYTPRTNEDYVAVFRFGNNDSVVVSLPKAQPRGITLTASVMAGDSVRITVLANAEALAELQGESYNVFVHRQGNGIYFGGRFGSNSSFILPRSYFPEGIAHITLFDQKNKPIADRAVFIKPSIPTITAEAARLKDSVRLALNTAFGSQPVSSNLSISFLPAGTRVNDFGRNIYSRYFLEADIKGFVEEPGYYFQGDWEARKNDMDNLLLVQGWRSYDWNKILNAQADSMAYAFEDGFTLKAVIPNYKFPKKKTDTTSFFLFVQKDGIFQEAKLTKWGSLLFWRLYLSDSSQVILNTADKKLRDNMEGLVASFEGRSFDTVAVASKPLLISRPAQPGVNDVLLTPGHDLEAVVIKTTIAEKKLFEGDPLINLGDRTYKVDNAAIERYRSLLDLLRTQFGVQSSVSAAGDVSIQMLPGALTGNGREAEPILIIDGMQTQNLNFLRLLKVSDVEAVGVNKFGNSMLGSRGAGGSISLKTRSSYEDPGYSRFSPVKDIWVEGYASPSQYFSPVYSVRPGDELYTKFAAIHWEPIITTDLDGKRMMTVPIPTELKKCILIIEGITVNGGLLHLEKEINLD